jgi:chemotaxis signal transduction protein
MDSKFPTLPADGEPPSVETSPTTLADPVSALDRAFVLPEEGTVRDGSGEFDQQKLQRMGFRVGELGLLFTWDAGREVVTPPPVSCVPNTAPWFTGLANVRGSLVPIVDTARAFGVARQTGAPGYLLIFGHGEDALGLLIDGLPRLFDLNKSQRLTSLPVLPALLEDGVVSAAYDHVGHVWLDLHLDALSKTLGQSIPL